MKDRRKNKSLIGVSHFVSSLLFPTRCVSCGDILSIAAGRNGACFCDKCMLDFASSVRECCTECGQSFAVCECAPDLLKMMGIERAYSCFAYDKAKRKSAASKLIFKLKSGADFATADFCADMLVSRLEKVGLMTKTEIASYTLTYAPRRKRAIRENGCDHMKKTAKLVAKRLGLPFESVFVNTARAAQKSKDALSRASAAELIKLKKRARNSVCGKNYIVIDDILTSGATLSACASRLFEFGANDVLVCVLAKTKST